MEQWHDLEIVPVVIPFQILNTLKSHLEKLFDDRWPERSWLRLSEFSQYLGADRGGGASSGPL